MHPGHLNPTNRQDIIHVKVVFGSGNPQPGILALIGGEIEFGKAAVIMISGLRVKNMRMVIIHWTMKRNNSGVRNWGRTIGQAMELDPRRLRLNQRNRGRIARKMRWLLIPIVSGRNRSRDRTASKGNLVTDEFLEQRSTQYELQVVC
jgi:hypothetical protein